ncbi:MAG: beta-galactosidase [bacterium]
MGGCPDPQFNPLVDQAADVGFNAIRIVVPWHQHETKPGEYDFAALDRALDYVVKTKRLKAVVLIWLRRPPEPIQKGNDTVLFEKDLQRDPAGQISSMFSFNSDQAVERAAAFVKRVVAHCHERYADDILGYVTPFSQFAEAEYWCEGEWGHEAHSLQTYRAWLVRKYGTIDKLNALSSNGRDWVRVLLEDDLSVQGEKDAWSFPEAVGNSHHEGHEEHEGQ